MSNDPPRKTVVVTGAGGFVGRNVMVRLAETKLYTPVAITRATDEQNRRAILAKADAVIHLAGVNRPKSDDEFIAGNVGATADLISALSDAGNTAPILYASSAKAIDETPYGRSKRDAETSLLNHAKMTGARVGIYRLPNVFGKWTRPNYNSAVATFCHNVARGLPIQVNDPSAPVSLVYVDDVIDTFLHDLADPTASIGQRSVAPVYPTTVGALADTIRGFRDLRGKATVDTVGTGLVRALYATYVASLEPADFAYPLVKHEDPRGWFSEFVKTQSAGQVSVFTAHPGITRGGHYHHTKTEKFLVVQGNASFKFRHITSDATHEIRTSGAQLTVVETVPGWAHDVTNVGQDLMVCVLWANELFDPNRPDTVAHKV